MKRIAPVLLPCVAPALLTVLVASAACGHDEEAPQRLGHFVDGPVVGLHFETPTQSGVTGADGEFAYRAGETVTFSVGGITLGATAGADQVTPFDLFGVAPPSTERDVRAMFDAGLPQGTHRAVNVAYLLQALDVDRDPDNGIDLGDWDTTLADERLAFDKLTKDFVRGDFSRFASRHPNIERSRPRWKVLLHLYETLGINVPVQRITGLVDSLNGASTRHVRITYDAQGRETVVLTDSDADGDDDSRSTTIYDARSNVVSFVNERDDDDDNASYESGTRTVTTYDGYDRELTKDVTTFTAGVDVNIVSVTTTYNQAGQTSLRTTDTDLDGNGEADYRTTETFVYDERGNLLSLTSADDFDGDGVGESLAITTSTFDAQNNELSNTSTYDNNGDHVPEQKTRHTYEYSPENLRLKDTLEYIDTADEHVVSRTTTITVYDASGLETTSTTELDFTADGVINSRTIVLTTYDADGYIVTQDYRFGAGATPSSTGRTTFTRDATGNVQLSEDDTDGDGSVDFRLRFTTTLDLEGHTSTFVRETDDEADGVYERAELSAYTLTAMADGFAYWVRQYMP